MPYERLNDKAAGEPLGPGHLNAQRKNISFLRSMMWTEHLVTGEHNAMEVPRVCAHVNNTTVTPSTTDITGVTHVAASGKYVIDLDVTRFSVADIRVQLTPIAENGIPAIATYKIVDGLPATLQVEVYLKHMTSALGVAGNTWADFDSQFEIAIHSQPLAGASWGAIEPAWERATAAGGYGLVGGGLNATPFGWSLSVQEIAELQAALTAEHTSAGAHNAHEVSKYAGRCYYNGTTYKCDDEAAFSFTRSSTGIILVDYSSLTTPVSAFFCADYERYNSGSDVPMIVNTTGSGATRTTVQCYNWVEASSWWQVADCDFYIAVHGS